MLLHNSVLPGLVLGQRTLSGLFALVGQRERCNPGSRTQGGPLRSPQPCFSCCKCALGQAPGGGGGCALIQCVGWDVEAKGEGGVGGEGGMSAAC